MKYFVTGGAGFIGSNLVDRLLADGHSVTVYDNLSTGIPRFLEGARKNERFRFIEGDMLDEAKLVDAVAGSEFLFHLAANADVRFGTEHPRKDLEQNTIATFNALEAVRRNNVGGIAFSSTGSVYGEAVMVPTPENAPFPVQTSLYGASKLAGEGLIAAYAEGFGIRGLVFRFVSVLGERYTHGHIFDFYRGLQSDPTRLRVLGNGTQRKSYMYVQDCIDAMLLAIDKAPGKFNVLNLGVDGVVQVNDSIRWICEELGISPRLDYTGGDRGWIGDNPLIHLDTSRIRTMGWQPRCSIKEGVLSTLRWLKANSWVYEERHG